MKLFYLSILFLFIAIKAIAQDPTGLGNCGIKSDLDFSPFDKGKSKSIKYLLRSSLINNKYGYIDTFGNVVINPIFDKAYPFTLDSLAIIEIDNKFGIINSNGKSIISPDFECISILGKRLIAVQKNNKWGLFDLSRKVIDPVFDRIETFFNSENDTLIQVKAGNKYGMYSINGQEIIPVENERMEKINGNIYTFRKGKNSKIRYYYFVSSNLIIPSELYYSNMLQKYNSIFNSSGLQVFTTDSTSQIVDSNGFIINEFPKSLIVTQSISDYGLFPYFQNNKIGFINEKGAIVTNAIFDDYDRLGEWSWGRIGVKLNEKFGLLGHDGNYIVKPNYDAIRFDFNASWIAVKIKNKWCFIDKKEKIILGSEFDEIHYFGNNIFKVIKNGNEFFIDNLGNLIVH